MNKLIVALFSTFLMVGCLKPLTRYSLAPLQGDEFSRTTVLARAFVAAGAEPEIVDERLQMVATPWDAPYGMNRGSEWTRRWVATIAPNGTVSIRGEVKICRLFRGCTDLNGEGTEMDVDALDRFAHGVGNALGVDVAVMK